ncbi:hypothetical protein ONE63_011119 [Megalurothrips usitatus]|uniref:C2H2-type domain-containing protein n=1 Tax=Megalurothrips usitatus TaxID=439358 RepID=A0AAV7XJQ2_9NEOP|nr:hypothetical protein ONE63_011119 [Megalurothrips usitatus]
MDSSFSLEDGGLIPITSTPKKAKPKEKCQYCGKGYVVKHYFNKHVESHLSRATSTSSATSTPVTTGNDALNESDASLLHLDASDVSFSALQGDTTNHPFKKPAPLPKKKGGFINKIKVQKKKNFVCTYCLKAYVSERTMRTHMRVHIMQVANCPSYGCSGQRFKELVGHVVGLNNFSDFSSKVLQELATVIETKQCMLPSALLKTLADKVEKISCNEKFCDECLSLLGVSDYDCDTQSQFIVEFLFNCLTEVFRFISASFRKHYQRPLKPMPELDAEDKQVIYYIGGSIMRGYFRIAHRHKNNPKWEKVCAVIKTHLLSSEPVGDIDAAWTRDIDRGSLLYITMPCQIFFLSVTKVVYENEKRDGSIDYDQVIDIVCKTSISVQWDDIIKDALPEDLSIGLMTDVVQCFSKACGRGVAKRRLNALRDKPIISMPTRHAVASRKT